MTSALRVHATRAVQRLRARPGGTVRLRCCSISAIAVATTPANNLSSSLGSCLVKDIVEALGGKGTLARSFEEKSLLIAVETHFQPWTPLLQVT